MDFGVEAVHLAAVGISEGTVVLANLADSVLVSAFGSAVTTANTYARDGVVGKCYVSDYLVGRFENDSESIIIMK